MSIFCALTSVIEFVILVAITGILASFAAVLRLMELTINLIHPLTILMLRQSGKLIVYGTTQSKNLMIKSYWKLRSITIFPPRLAVAELRMQQPFIPYQRNVLGMVEETFPRKEDVMFRERLMEKKAELDDEDDDVGKPVSERNMNEKGVETKLEEMEEMSDETKENIEEEGLDAEEEKEEKEEEEKEEEEEQEQEEEEKDDVMIPSKTSDD
ncbi:glutamic acid-rich protein-like [Apis laboriosa]|uniref:glutamic acid-rich protein-like n=1 Tax=Apis laboriosa TaxID=183418 RepID=UPI001CC4EF19|nr:glutamic acid-rich protein-like [Apis laboriosa]